MIRKLQWMLQPHGRGCPALSHDRGMLKPRVFTGVHPTAHPLQGSFEEAVRPEGYEEEPERQ